MGGVDRALDGESRESAFAGIHGRGRHAIRSKVTISEVRAADGGLADRFGRVATDLRVSLTDRCNLRCTYCMPAEGLAWLPREELLV